MKLALREAVLNQAYSFNYVDRILLSWERKNLRTKQQVEEDQKRRKQQLLQREVEQPTHQEELPKVSLEKLVGGVAGYVKQTKRQWKL